MAVWKISGNDLPVFYVKADSFDKALSIARQKNDSYNAGNIQLNYVTLTYRVFGKDGHRQRASFGETYSFTTFDDVRIKCFCSDTTGSNYYVDVAITAKDCNTAIEQMEKQLSDGIFENCRYGKVVIVSAE